MLLLEWRSYVLKLFVRQTILSIVHLLDRLVFSNSLNITNPTKSSHELHFQLYNKYLISIYNKLLFIGTLSKVKKRCFPFLYTTTLMLVSHSILLLLESYHTEECSSTGNYSCNNERD